MPDAAVTVGDVRSRMGDLRLWLALDAGATGLNGLGYLVFSKPLEDALGPSSMTLMVVGAGLVGFALLVASAAGAPGRLVAARAVIGVNISWVVASIINAATAAPIHLTATGRLWVAAQAVLVSLFAVMQLRTIAAHPSAAASGRG